MTLVDLIFYVVAALVVASAAYAAFSRNIVRAVFSLLGTFFGVAILYGLLAADFVAVIQVMVYVGGILVLMLFAVMLTANIETAARSSRSGGMLLGGILGAALLLLLLSLALRVPWKQAAPSGFPPTTASIGEVLLQEALLPFEVVGVVLLGVVIGVVVIARTARDKETNR